MGPQGPTGPAGMECPNGFGASALPVLGINGQMTVIFVCVQKG